MAARNARDTGSRSPKAGCARAPSADAEAVARVEGDEAAWVAAFGPHADISGLRFYGKRSIAKRLLDSLPRDNRL